MISINLFDEGPSKIRYLKLKNALYERRKDLEAVEINYSQLRQYEISLSDAKKFYVEKYGLDLIELFDAVKERESYKKVS